MIEVHGKKFRQMFTAAEIQAKVKGLGREISLAYKGKNPLFLGVLNGGFIFAADLVRACDIECEISFVKMSSYKGVSSTGDVATLLGLDTPIKGRDIIIVEDIVDTGRTLEHFIDILELADPNSIALASCLIKPEALLHTVDIHYVCFAIPNEFVIGYGLDYEGLGRNLKGIYSLV